MQNLELELSKIVLGSDDRERIKALFFETIPAGTYIYNIDEDYESKVAKPIQCAARDYGADYDRYFYIRGVQFLIEDDFITVIQCLDEDGDIEDCECSELDVFPANYSVLLQLLWAYDSGWHSDSPVSLITEAEAEEEEEEEEEEEDED